MHCVQLNMEVLVGLDEEFRSFYPLSSRSASGTPLFSSAERPTSINSESLTPYVSFPVHIAPNSSVTYGCNFGSSCYCCKVPQNALFPPSCFKQSANGQSEPVDNGDASRWFKEFALCQGYYYPRIPACIDLPIVHRAGDHTHDTCWTMEDHQPWDWSNNCSSSQLYYSKHQTQSPHIWKPSLAEERVSFCQRGRKKRVPYTKLQLKQLEWEFTNTKFITKEKRLRISASTNLSERHVSIWFQNRRVKDKKKHNKDLK